MQAVKDLLYLSLEGSSLTFIANIRISTAGEVVEQPNEIKARSIRFKAGLYLTMIQAPSACLPPCLRRVHTLAKFAHC